jgi:hypothetical protein
MVRRTGIFLAASAAILVCTAATAGPPAPVRTADGNDAYYKATFPDGCYAEIHLDLRKGEFSGMGIHFDGVEDCRHPLAENMEALEVLLAAAEANHELAGVTSVTDFESEAVWGERMVDCYVAKFGPHDRIIYRRNMATIIAALNGCAIFTELQTVLLRHNLPAHLDAIEKMQEIDLRGLSQWPQGWFDEAWLRKHRGQTTRAPVGGWIEFER